ncbi:low molecular weight phosphotyrosine protein phosphatase [Halopseudomonas nanhaiensis]|uniref:arsenate reductase/protein-tyrosine-phosphatase family protein n=1 Tax=Halopseudomonas nanhaiensis TaxID=2830842 RepID=UPI001CBE4751|nr:low molecular weight phosphotyrosine protein phosphatase [Halopseudomonas nanhaiensis]UAW99453.1 low molecular weight phosphotyrosine protein phosphatase [Halopseudomonas nanhaiensis]
MFKSILIVCVGNICRSPTAEALLKHKLQGYDIKVTSAGLGALVGKGVDPTAAAVMAEHDISLHDHMARQLTREMVRDADLILTMETRHIKAICELTPEARGKTFLFGRWLNGCETPDPYRQQRQAFVHVYQILDKAANAWLPYLVR